MRSFSGSALLLLLLLSLLASLSLAGLPKQAMLLQDVTSLVFSKGEMTNSRRSSPVPQMKCTGGHCQYAPSSALCRNAGFDGVDVTWKCEAELPKGVHFGKVEVSCEGYGSRDDEKVLKGSCGLEYSLAGEPIFESEEREEDTWINRNIKRNAGEKMHPHKIPNSHPQHPDNRVHYNPPSTASSWLSWLTDSSQQAKDYAHRQYDHASDAIHQHSQQHHAAQSSWGPLAFLVSLFTSLFSLAVKLIAALVIFYVVYKLLRPSTSVPPPSQRTSPSLLRSALGALPFASLLGGGFPFSSSNQYNSPPPPYPGTTPPPYSAHPYDKSSYTQPPPTPQSQQSQQGSGFSVLHGLLGGSLLGYFLGRQRAAPAAQSVHTQPSTSSWFGGSGMSQPQTVHHVHHNAPPVSQPTYGTRGGERYPTASTAASYDTEVPEERTTETATAYARTKRR